MAREKKKQNVKRCSTSEPFQKFTTTEIENLVSSTITDVDHTSGTSLFLASVAESVIKAIEKEAATIATIQGRNFVTNRDFMLASRILGIIK